MLPNVRWEFGLLADLMPVVQNPRTRPYQRRKPKPVTDDSSVCLPILFNMPLAFRDIATLRAAANLEFGVLNFCGDQASQSRIKHRKVFNDQRDIQIV